MKALVTRPAEDAASLAAALAARGIEPLLEPLLTIRFVDDGGARLAPLLPGAQALLFTSANGVRAFAAAFRSLRHSRDGEMRRELLTLPVFTVGDATADAARAAGFADVVSAGGTVDDLARLVIAHAAPTRGTLLHPAASAVAGDLAGHLAGAGFEVRRAVLYDAVPAAVLRDQIRHALQIGALDFAFFFSPRTAATFVELARSAELVEACVRATAFALSPAVGTALEAVPWRAIVIAKTPREAALLAALDDMLPPRPDGRATRSPVWHEGQGTAAR